MTKQDHIRNFCIVSHVDHGKSTLADRLLEITNTVPKDKLKPQLLDSLVLERERGITIKLAPVRMQYTLNAIPFTLNLIDTPGHVDFSYEVSRSLAAVEGAVLLVDATQGIQAQTLAHGLAAVAKGLILVPAINKIDLPNANIEQTKKQLVETFGFDENEIVFISAKTGQGVEKLLAAIIKKVLPPKTNKEQSLRALIMNSFFDSFKGVIAQVRVFDGRVPAVGEKIYFLGTGAVGEVIEKGYSTPTLAPSSILASGEIGYVATGIKQPNLVRVGDTISTQIQTEPLPGYKEVKPMVFVGFYPFDPAEFPKLKESLFRLRLSDPAFSFLPEQSTALGAGFRCGFLGLLHAEVVQQRLSEEFDIDILATTPSVAYLVGETLIHNPAELPSRAIEELKEPWVSLKIFTPRNYLGRVLELAQDKRGLFVNIQHFGPQAELSYEMPLQELITDFYDKLKSVSSGFASLDWNFLEFREVDGVRIDILVAGERVDALSSIIVRSKAESFGRKMVKKLKEVLPRQNFEVAIQAVISGKIIARETLSAYRKDVTAKLYGGDRTRKDKLLDKQKKGKKRMKMVGRVQIPKEAFVSILRS